MGEVPLEEDVFKILIATDNHLGYGERKPVIQNDSFRAFEEILQLAVKNDVDFILLGGDLFHESQPSPYCMYRCSQLLKKYCFGDKPVSIEFLSDQSDHFSHLKNPIVNYEDPNLNISLPIFSIHGNHDSPSGNQLVSALDILSCSGLINYFGRWTDLSSVEVNPILLRKGATKIALYGLSHIPDQRLARLFHENKVKMPRDEGDDYFNILILHQNRAERGIKNYIPYNVIPRHINFVVWGHEHDCNIHPTQYTKDGPKICQPGSSVATSLSEGESMEKHVGLLQIYQDTYKFIPIRLKSVRPFIFDEIILCKPESEDYDLEDPKQQAINDVKAKVEAMIETAMIKQEDSGNEPLLPLIKLVVKYHNESQIFNNTRLGHEFEEKVANPGEMFKLVIFTPKERKKRGNGVGRMEDGEFDDSDVTSVEEVVEQFFRNYSRGEAMNVLSVKLMTKAVSRFVEVGDSFAMRVAFENQIKKTVDKLIEKDPDDNGIKACLEVIKQERIQDEDKEVKELMSEFENQRRAPPKTTAHALLVADIEVSDDEVEEVELPPKPTRGRGSRGGRGSRAGTSGSSAPRRRARAK